MSRTISFTVPDAESEAGFLLAVLKRAIKAYRDVAPHIAAVLAPSNQRRPLRGTATHVPAKGLIASLPIARRPLTIKARGPGFWNIEMSQIIISVHICTQPCLIFLLII